MSSPLKRIKAYIDFKGIKISTFEKSAGFSNGSFGGQLKKNKSIGTDKLEHILEVYPDLNATWVLTGRESMLKNDPGGREEPIGCCSSMERRIKRAIEGHHEEVIESLNGLIAAQQKTIAILERLLKQSK